MNNFKNKIKKLIFDFCIKNNIPFSDMIKILKELIYEAEQSENIIDRKN